MLYRSYVFGPFNPEDLDETENREKRRGIEQKCRIRAATMRMLKEHEQVCLPSTHAALYSTWAGPVVFFFPLRLFTLLLHCFVPA